MLIHTGTRFFRSPQPSDLEDVDLVVATLSTSRGLAQILKPGHFSHILLDEAAQVSSLYYCFISLLEMAIRRIFGSDSDSYKNPFKKPRILGNLADCGVLDSDSGLQFKLRIWILSGPKNLVGFRIQIAIPNPYSLYQKA